MSVESIPCTPAVLLHMSVCAVMFGSCHPGLGVACLSAWCLHAKRRAPRSPCASPTPCGLMGPETHRCCPPPLQVIATGALLMELLAAFILFGTCVLYDHFNSREASYY